MASNPSGQAMPEKMVAKLENQIKLLQMENQTLRRQVSDARSDADVRTRHLTGLRCRSGQRRENKQKLVSARHWVYSAQIITAIITISLGVYVGFPSIVYAPMFDEFPKLFRYYLGWKINEKLCSLSACSVGFLICIPAQRVFPAPTRVFYGTVVLD